MKWIFLILLFYVSCYGQTNFYVASSGSDANPGTLAEPFLTLDHARDAVRGLSHPLASPATVWIRGGRYYFQSALALTGSQDSGTATGPVTYKAYPNETPYLIGGIVATNFVAVTNVAVLARLTASAQTNVLVADLTAQGITNLGVLTNHGYGHYDGDQFEQPFQSELLFQDRAMQLARWPNMMTSNPRTNWVLIDASGTVSNFTYVGANPGPWSEVTNVWLQGYWGYDYSDSWERLVAINTNTKTLTVNYLGANGTQYGNAGAYAAGHRFFYFNILEELDMAGEYFIDRSVGKLYFWPPSVITNGACIVSITTNIVTLSGVSNVAFSGIVFEGGKSALIQIDGGQSNLVTHCTINSGSADGIKILSSFNTGVSYCSLFDLGERGVWFWGSGTRLTLTSGSNYVSYNVISNISRLCAGVKNAVTMSYSYPTMDVVGVYVGHNLIHTIPHQAMIVYGNDHVIEYNEIHHVCTETADAGAIYGGYDWTQRGTIIRYNYFHDINLGGGANEYDGVIGIYEDAAWSGTTIHGNVFCDVDHGIYVNGGRDNLIYNNIFVDCTNNVAGERVAYAIEVSQCGLVNGFDDVTGTMWNRLTNMPYQGLLWSNAYPALAMITNGPTSSPNSNAVYALGNVIATNISYSNGVWLAWENNANTNVTPVNNLTNSDPLFVNYAARDFNLQPSSPAWALGWVRIPLELIGPNPRYPVVGNVNTLRVGTMRMAQ